MAGEAKTALALRDDQDVFDKRQTAALTQLGVSNATEADLAVFFHQCRRTGLDPFARQIYMIKRRQWDSDAGQMEDKQTIQTGIDGFRLVARRAADRARESLSYEDTLWCGPDGVWVDVWTKSVAPYAAKQVIHRNGERFSAVALFAEYAATKKNRQTSALELTGQWVVRPSHMIAKCAEALVLRKAFPQDLSGVYTEEELERVEVIDGQVVPPASAEQSGPARDWQAEASAVSDPAQLQELWRACRDAGALNAELRQLFIDRAKAMQPKAVEPVTAPPEPEQPDREPEPAVATGP